MIDPGHGFPRSARLLKPAEFRRVFQRARRVQDGCFTVLCRRNGGEPARLGLAIARKQVRRAVDRNRVKRIVRDSFRQQRVRLAGHDIIVMARGNAASADKNTLRHAIDGLWDRLLSSPDP